MDEANLGYGGLYERLRRELGNMRLVDAHEHLPSEEQWLAQGSDFASMDGFLGYAAPELVIAGMPKDTLLPEMNAEEKWQQIRPFWRRVRDTGSGALCRRALFMFCEVGDLEDSTIPIVQAKLASLRKPGIYRRLLNAHNIAACLNVRPEQVFREASACEFFAPLLITSQLALIQRRSDVHKLEKATHQDIYSLNTYLQALDALLEQKRRDGFVGIKWHTLAYLRDIHYPLEDAHSAEKCLDRILRMPARAGIASDTAVGFDEMRPFQNFIQHHLVQRAIELDWPVQIHTGIFGASYGAQISHSNPTHLTDLFLRYPQARFDLLHASYPYMGELAALTKLFPNVYINMAWFDILSPRAAKQYLREWITSVPLNKVFAFGGDQVSVLLSCAYAETVRDNLAQVLADEVAEGNMTEERALEIATYLLEENVWEYFRLQDRWASRHQKPAPA